VVNFLIFIDNIAPFTKNDIDKGTTPPDIYKICVTIRETFLISYDIRKENALYFYIEYNHILIKFLGNELRFLGPDQRSQALLLNKALNKINQIQVGEKKNEWVKSTPGIYAKRLKSNKAFIHFLVSKNFGWYIFIFDRVSPLTFPFLYHTFEYPKIKKFNQLEDLKSLFYILPFNSSSNERLIELLKLFTHMHSAKLDQLILTSLHKITTLPDKILYMNFQIDQQEDNGKSEIN